MGKINEQELYIRAKENYIKGKYADAGNYFIMSLEDGNYIYEKIYFAGLCAFYENNINKAIALFESIIDIKRYEYYYSTKWYLVWAYLKNGEIKKAKTILNYLEQSISEDYKTKSKELLIDLENFR